MKWEISQKLSFCHFQLSYVKKIFFSDWMLMRRAENFDHFPLYLSFHIWTCNYSLSFSLHLTHTCKHMLYKNMQTICNMGTKNLEGFSEDFFILELVSMHEICLNFRKKCFRQLSGARSTRKLVEIHITLPLYYVVSLTVCLYVSPPVCLYINPLPLFSNCAISSVNNMFLIFNFSILVGTPSIIFCSSVWLLFKFNSFKE